ALGLFLAIGGFGGMGMGPAIQASINAYGWRHTFLFISLLVLVFAIIVPAIFIRNRPEEVGQVSDGAQGLDDTADTRKPMPIKAAYKTPVDFTAKEAMRTRCFWLLVVYYSMNMLAMNAVMVPQMPHLNDIGVNNIVGAFALSIMVGVMSFSQFGTGFIGMKFSMHSIAICAEIIKAIGLIILVTTRSLPFVFVYMVCLGLGFGAFIVAMMNILPNYFGAKYYPKIMGNARLFFAIIGSAGAPIAGHIKDITDSFIPAFQGAVVIIIVGIIFLALAKPPVHPSLRKSHQTNSPTV
ncbi:MAG: MFS transporter, partial [Acidobacteriota bacterium]